jgi:hypothetical protein
MFDGGELYGTFQAEQPSMEKPLPPPPIIQQNKTPPPQDMYYHEEPKQVVYQQQQQPAKQSEGFFDRISAKRFEILKVFSFALIIVLAISIDRVNTHYLTKYVTNSILTSTQELLLRVSYPITVLIIIWLLKLV